MQPNGLSREMLRFNLAAVRSPERSGIDLTCLPTAVRSPSPASSAAAFRHHGVKCRMLKIRSMKLILLFTAASICLPAANQKNPDAARWEREARNVTIVRDDWGIAHVFGKTDADAVFGMIYAQAEDDFNRVETNYINAMGRLAEAEGEARIYQDLRMKLFIDPEALKKEYAESPVWLKRLMNAFADGVNYFLSKHPEVKPRVITRFEPWMALGFTEGSIGGDIERINLKQLEAFYGKVPVSEAASADQSQLREPTGSNGIAIAPSNTLS